MSEKLINHIYKHVHSAKRGASSFIMDINDFSCLDNKYRNEFIANVEFESVDHYPPCTKYKYPKEIHFKNPGDNFCNNKMIAIEVIVDQLVALNEKHFLNLHPARYDRIKEEISNGFVIMPYVQMELGVPTVTGGRHRVIALRTLGLINIPVSIPLHEYDEISSFLHIDTIKESYFLK